MDDTGGVLGEAFILDFTLGDERNITNYAYAQFQEYCCCGGDRDFHYRPSGLCDGLAFPVTH